MFAEVCVGLSFSDYNLNATDDDATYKRTRIKIICVIYFFVNFFPSGCSPKIPHFWEIRFSILRDAIMITALQHMF